MAQGVDELETETEKIDLVVSLTNYDILQVCFRLGDWVFLVVFGVVD